MLSVLAETAGHPLLFYPVESDDIALAQRDDVLWFEILRAFDWKPLQMVAARYYEALWCFNHEQSEARRERERSAPVANAETREDATLRLLFARPTMDPEAVVLTEMEACESGDIRIDPRTLRPGMVPARLWGRAPKCFFAMFKAFLGLPMLGRPAEPEFVEQELVNNPSYARACGFTVSDPEIGYRQTDVPSRRKLEQFDQIMTKAGLWAEAAVGQVRRNLEKGILRANDTVVHDTTHYRAFSDMHVVTFPQEAEGKEPRKKSHPRTTKACRCAEREGCPHPWVSADEGAGTVVKSGGKMIWGHKASTISFAGQELLLDAVAMSDAATHDSRSLLPHLERLATLHPEVMRGVSTILDDGALDDEAIRKAVKERFGADLVVKPNPRGKKALTQGLPAGIREVTTAGTPVCVAGFPFDFLGCRHTEERFLFRAPDDEEGRPVCAGCGMRDGCLRPEAACRHLSLPFELLPHLDPRLPHLSRRFERLTAKRTVIERIHKLMKFDYGSERLSKRGNASFQATLDKTLLAMHLVAAG
jgi:hypothetical protein